MGQHTFEDNRGNKWVITADDLLFKEIEDDAIKSVGHRLDFLDLGSTYNMESSDERKERVEREAGFKTIEDIPIDDAQYYMKKEECPKCSSKMRIYSREPWGYHWCCERCNRIYLSCIPDPMGTIEHRHSLSHIEFL